MSFLSPLFFLGLGTIVIPILVHLIQRERKRVIEFPSLMFVQKIPYQSVRRRRIRHWFLLLLRAAAIVLFVAAFARPFFARGAAALAAAGGSRAIVILLVQSTQPRREAVLISDFQKTGWTGGEDIRFGENMTLTPVSVASDTTANISVPSVTFARAQFSGQER